MALFRIAVWFWPLLINVLFALLLTRGTDLSDRQVGWLFFLSLLTLPMISLDVHGTLPARWGNAKRGCVTVAIIIATIGVDMILFLVAGVVGMYLGDQIPV